jgi:hypothetical protein
LIKIHKFESNSEDQKKRIEEEKKNVKQDINEEKRVAHTQKKKRIFSFFS